MRPTDPDAREVPAPRLLFLGGGAVVAECYVPALRRLGWLRQALVVESSRRNAEALRQRQAGLRVLHGAYRQALEDTSLISGFDGVVVALPNCLHEDAVSRSLVAGLHVLCEKPLTLSAEGCRRLGAEAQKAGRCLSVGMARRLIPTVRAIGQAIRSGMIGELTSIEIAHGSDFHWPSMSHSYFLVENGGILLNMGVHYLDMIETWVGALTPVRYRDDFAGGVEASCAFELGATGGVLVQLELSYTRPLANRIVIVGTAGTITADVDDFGACTWCSTMSDLTATLTPTRPFRSGDWPLDFASTFTEQLFEFARAIDGVEEPRSNAYQAAETLGLIEWGHAHRQPIQAPALRRCAADRPSLEPASVVVTGGTGFVGVKLVERLHELGFERMRIPVRSYGSGADVARYPVERVLTDLLDYASVREAVRGARYVFHLAYGKDGRNAARVTVAGTRNVVDACVETGVDSVVMVSTASVFGWPSARYVDESYPYRSAPGDQAAYSRSKARAERYCLRRARSSGTTRIVVLSPSAIYGPGSWLFTEFPARAAQDGSFCWIDAGHGRFNYVFVDNFVDALLLAVQCDQAHGQRFLVSDGAVSVREFLAPMLGAGAANLQSYNRQQLQALARNQQAGWRDLFRALTTGEMMRVVNGVPALAVSKRWAERRLGRLYARAQHARSVIQEERSRPDAGRPVPPLWLSDVFGPIPFEYSSEKARKVLGWSPGISLAEGQQICLAWLERLGLVAPPHTRGVGGRSAP